MTTKPTFYIGYVPVTDLQTVTDQAWRGIPIKGVRINTPGPGAVATTSATTEMDLAKHAITGLTMTTGRYYLFRAMVTFTKTVGSDTFDLKLRANTPVSGTQIGLYGQNFTDALTGGCRVTEFLFVGDASYTSLYLSVVRTAGTGTLSYYGQQSGFNRSWSALHDQGDTDNWTDVT